MLVDLGKAEAPLRLLRSGPALRDRPGRFVIAFSPTSPTDPGCGSESGAKRAKLAFVGDRYEALVGVFGSITSLGIKLGVFDASTTTEAVIDVLRRLTGDEVSMSVYLIHPEMFEMGSPRRVLLVVYLGDSLC